MKSIGIKHVGLLVVGLLAAANASAQVGVSISVGQPGFYGQIDIGDVYPAPRIISAQPVIIHAQPAYLRGDPIYLRVPPGHAKRWSKYCGRYDACGRPVYFVNNAWYNETYAPRYREYNERGDDGRRFERNDYGDRKDKKDKKSKKDK